MALWDRIREFFGFAPDARPDAEDTAAYARFQHITEKFGEHGAHVQILKDPAKKPTDVGVGRTELGITSPQGGMQSWVDVYDGPQGKGYVVNFEVTRGQKKFQKSINVGPEKHREKDWTEVVEVLP